MIGQYLTILEESRKEIMMNEDDKLAMNISLTVETCKLQLLIRRINYFVGAVTKKKTHGNFVTTRKLRNHYEMP